MKNFYYLFFFLLLTSPLISQSTYFPPIDGDDWETMDPAELNWCEEKIDSLYTFLDEGNSKAFLILKDGKIVLEQYFDDFTRDDVWRWASVGKPMMGTLMGIAEQDGYLNLDEPTSDYLGTAWTSAPADKEALITLRHHLSMTTGLTDNTNTCTLPSCLGYLADAGTRWAYHNATYYLLADVLEEATGKDFNQYFDEEITATIGVDGDWVNSGYAKILSTTPRDMARFGLLFLNNGKWGTNQIIEDSIFFQNMITPSQDLNLSYGYYWWLNGQESYMFPETQVVFSGSLAPDAPTDLYTGVGYGGQYLNIIPSLNMVLVRMGEFPDGPPHPTIFNNQIWQIINELECNVTSTKEPAYGNVAVYPNPTDDILRIDLPESMLEYSVEVFDVLGAKKIQVENLSLIGVEHLPKGVYHVVINGENNQLRSTFVKS